MSEKSTMNKKDALELYKIFKQQSATSLNNYHNSIQHYRTLIAAILGASVAVITIVSRLDLRDQRLTALLMFIIITLPIVNTQLCKRAIETCDRCYHAWLETITIQVKLEPIIGLASQRPKSTAEDTITPFSQDNHIIPRRWLEPGQFSTAEGFVEEYLGKGSNKLAHQLFAGLLIVNYLFAGAIVLMSLYLFFSTSTLTIP